MSAQLSISRVDPTRPAMIARASSLHACERLERVRVDHGGVVEREGVAATPFGSLAHDQLELGGVALTPGEGLGGRLKRLGDAECCRALL